MSGLSKAGLIIRRGHTDEVPGGGLRRPVEGCCWELRIRGIRNGMRALPLSVEA